MHPECALHLLIASTGALQGDGLDAGDVTDLAESVAEKIDVLVNNAGMAASGDLQDSLLEGTPFLHDILNQTLWSGLIIGISTGKVCRLYRLTMIVCMGAAKEML